MSRSRVRFPMLAVSFLAIAGVLAVVAPSGAASGAVTLAQGLETVPIVLTGADFPGWAPPENVAYNPGGIGGGRCNAGDLGAPEPISNPDDCTHNRFEEPTAQTGSVTPAVGVDVGTITG